MHGRWDGFSGSNPSTIVFSMRRRSPLRINSEMEVFMGGGNGPEFRCEGCFAKRSCKIWSANGEIAAIIAPKRVVNSEVSLGDDVFSLVVNHGFKSEVIMGFVVAMDRMCC